MRRKLIRTVVVAATLTFVACAGEESEAVSDTSATSAGLLSGMPRSAVTPMGNDNLPPTPTQEWDFLALGFNSGSSEAPVRVVELSDFGCGYCRQFHMETFPTLLTDFIESGKVEWKFLPFVTGMFGNSLTVTEAAECTLAQSPELFEVLSERLWADQSGWKRSNEPEVVVRTMAQEAGVDVDEFDACLADDRRMEHISAATAAAGELGVRGTPTFFIIGFPPLQGALPTEAFVEILTAVYTDAVQDSVN